MTIDWSEEARQQFLSSLSGIYDTLLFFLKEEKFFLIPEIILQWIEDIYLYKNGKHPQHSILTTCYELGIELTEEERSFLRVMERSSRKEEAYRKFVKTLAPSPFLFSLITKIYMVHQN